VKRIVIRFAVYQLICWTVVAVVAGSVWRLGVVVVALLAVYTTVPLVIFLRHRGWPRYPGAAIRLFVVRPFWYVQLLLPLVTIASLLGAVVGAVAGDPLGGARVGGGLVLAAMSALLLTGYLGSKRLAVRRLTIARPDLPPDLDGMVIAQISDMHVGPHLSARFFERAARHIREAKPDLIAITGDLVDDRPEDVTLHARYFGDLTAPLGVYIVPGNHDVYAGWAAVRERLQREQPATVLVNESRLVTRGGTTFAVVGTGDPAGRQWKGSVDVAPDVGRALERVPRNTFVVALAHNPALWPALAKAGVDVTLSGHTHWGQFSFPRWRWSLASPFLPHAMGVYEDDGAVLYISPGTGYWGIPFRLGAPAEVTVLTLRRGQPDPHEQ
jgi:predicted MPP superfamily phosphohydrolase